MQYKQAKVIGKTLDWTRRGESMVREAIQNLINDRVKETMNRDPRLTESIVGL